MSLSNVNLFDRSNQVGTHMTSQPQTQMVLFRMLHSGEGRAVEDLRYFSLTNPQHTMTVDPAEQHDTLWISLMDFPIISSINIIIGYE